MLRLILLLSIVLSTQVFGEIKQERFPVSAVLSAPFPTEVVAANNTATLAFVLNERGARNIFMASGPDFDAMKLTHYTADNGVGVSDVAFTPDDTKIVYVRGAGPNRAGELPNPAALPLGTEQSIYMLTLDGGAPRKLDDGAGPAIHPDGKNVAYVKAGSVWLKGLHNAEAEAEATMLFAIRGGNSELSWSPDGKSLSFVSRRGTHSYVGVWTQGDQQKPDGSIVWLSPSVDQDISPIWSPDSKQVAFIRLPSRAYDHFPFEPIRQDLPWSIRVADISSGQSKEIWRADKGRGSVNRSFESDVQLFWGANDRLIFAWEKNGWNQLYSVSANGGKVFHLTPGNFEIEYAALTKDRKSVVYASNQDDMHRRHLWQVNIKGRKAKLLTPGQGIEWSPTPLVDGNVGFVRSTATQPARAAVMNREGMIKDLATSLIPEDFPDNLVTPSHVDITATDGMTVPAQLFLPSNVKPGDRAPVAIFLHGGSRRQMLLGWHMRGYYHNAYGMSQYMASRGVIALALNYRSGTGYGMEFREALDYGATGNSEFRDVIGAGLYLKSRADVDPERITVWGGSYGGYLTAHALAQASDMFAAGVDIHGVHDWNDGIRIFVPQYNKNDFPVESAIAKHASPFHYIDGWRSPVLLIHGDDDRNVFFSQTTRLARKLRERNVHVEQLVFPDEVHGFLLHSNWVKAYDATAEFLLRHMND